MELKPYKKLTGLEYDLSKTVQYTEEYLNQFSPLIFLKGNLLSIAVTTSAITFDHGLQQAPQGWIIFDKDSNANVWKVGATNKTITFNASASSNIKVWVF
jgi:hypothetical protein